MLFLGGNLSLLVITSFSTPISSIARSVQRDTCENATSNLGFLFQTSVCFSSKGNLLLRILEKKGPLSGSFYSFFNCVEGTLWTENTLCLVLAKPLHILSCTDSSTFSSWIM